YRHVQRGEIGAVVGADRERPHGLNVERERDDEENRGEAGVEAEELHAGVARDEQQRDDDADAEVREEQEEDGGERHAGVWDRWARGIGGEGAPLRAYRSVPTQPTGLHAYLPCSRLLISAQLTTFHHASTGRRSTSGCRADKRVSPW